MDAEHLRFNHRVATRIELRDPAQVDWVARTTIRALRSNLVVMPQALVDATPVELREEFIGRRLPPPPEPSDVYASVRRGLLAPAGFAEQFVRAVLEALVQPLPPQDRAQLREALPRAWAEILTDAGSAQADPPAFPGADAAEVA